MVPLPALPAALCAGQPRRRQHGLGERRPARRGRPMAGLNDSGRDELADPRDRRLRVELDPVTALEGDEPLLVDPAAEGDAASSVERSRPRRA